MPKCKKCGESLHPEQKVCIACGTQTVLWDGGATKDEKPPIVIPWTPVAIIGCGLLFFIIIIAFAMHFRIMPPDEVTSKWLDAVTSRNIKHAQEYTLPSFENTILDQPASAEKADDYQQFLYNNGGSYKVSKPEYDSPNSPKSAVVKMTFTGTNGEVLVEYTRLVLTGRKWKITSVIER